MGRSQYRRGVAFERLCQEKLEIAGWRTMRSAGSHGVADLIALRDWESQDYTWSPTSDAAWIQCKAGRAQLSPLERRTLFELAERTGAIAVLARRPAGKSRGIEWLRLTGAGAKDRERWEP